MPVQTRNQIRNQIVSNSQLEKEREQKEREQKEREQKEREQKEREQKEREQKVKWYTTYCKKMIAAIEEFNKEKEVYGEFTLKRRENYFEQLRLVTELYYIIEQYIDNILLISSNTIVNWRNFINVSYQKIHYFRYSMSLLKNSPETQSEKKVVQALSRQLISTEEVFKKHLTNEQISWRAKRAYQPKLKNYKSEIRQKSYIRK